MTRLVAINMNPVLPVSNVRLPPQNEHLDKVLDDLLMLKKTLKNLEMKM
jgi:hypothetical protein